MFKLKIIYIAQIIFSSWVCLCLAFSWNNYAKSKHVLIKSKNTFLDLLRK